MVGKLDKFLNTNMTKNLTLILSRLCAISSSTRLERYVLMMFFLGVVQADSRYFFGAFRAHIRIENLKFVDFRRFLILKIKS